MLFSANDKFQVEKTILSIAVNDSQCAYNKASMFINRMDQYDFVLK